MSTKPLKMVAFVSLLLVICIAWGKIEYVQGASDFASGSGTPEDPYIIETYTQLDNVRFHLDSHFKLGEDIDFPDYSEGEGWDPIASGFDTSHPDTLFTGSFDGNGFTISNLVIDREELCQGLFAAVGEEGEIRNVHLEGVMINGSSCVGSLVGLNYGVIENASVNFGLVQGDDFVGGLVGRHSGELVGSHAHISVNGVESVGGLVGLLNGLNDKTVSIRDSYASGDVDGATFVGGLIGRNETDNKDNVNVITNSYAEGNVTGDSQVGGFIGSNAVLPGGTIIVRNSYATGNVTGHELTGGFIGYNHSSSNSNTIEIVQNYATGEVSGKGGSVDTIHGFIGEHNTHKDSESIVENNLWVKDHYSDPLPDNGFGTPVTWEELSDPDTFGDWDFSDGWYQYEGVMPFHDWQNPLIFWEISIENDRLTVDDSTRINVQTEHQDGEQYDGVRSARFTIDPDVPEIVSVDPDGTVNAVKGGQATITVSLFGNLKSFDIVVDSGDPDPPTITLAPDGWTNADEVLVTIDHEAKNHQKADVKTIRIKVGDGEWNDYAFVGDPVIFNVTEEGQTIIRAQAVDEIENVSDIVEQTVKISRSGLRLESKLHLTSDDQQTYPGETWTNQSVTAHVYASHDQGLDLESITYSIDERKTWKLYQHPLEFSDDGQFPLWLQVKDVAGNVMDEQVMIWIDQTKPVIKFDPEGNETDADNISSRVNVLDLLSGVAEDSLLYVWSIHNHPLSEHADWQPFSNNRTLTHTDTEAGEWYLHIRAKDRAGNESYEISDRFRLKDEKPAPQQPSKKSNRYIRSNISDIGELNLDGVSLTPEFAEDITEYRGYVAYEVDRMDLTVRAAHSLATIAINGETIGHDPKPVTIPLNEGLNTIEIVVTAEDGTEKTYTIIIERESEPQSPSVQHSLADIEGHWAEAWITRAILNGWVNGYPDDTFKPNDPVTRAEFMVMLAKALHWEEESIALDFRDQALIGSWAESAIAQAVEAGVISGYEDGTFRPDKPLTRTEVAVILTKILDIQLEEVTQTSFADDESIPEWGKPYVESMRKSGILNGREDHRFAPNDPATRAEAVVILFRILERAE